MDGGTIWDVNVDSAVNACLNMGYSQEDIIIDTLVCSYTEMPTETDIGNTVNNFAQSFHIHGALNNGDAVAAQERAYPNVNYRYYFQDHDDGCGVSDLLDFNNSTTWCLQVAGRKQAQDALTLQKWEEEQAKPKVSVLHKVLKVLSFFRKL